MQGVGSVSRDFEKENKAYLLFLNDKALSIASFAKNNQSLDKYRIANDKWFSQNVIEIMKKVPFSELKEKGYLLYDNYFYVLTPVYDLLHKKVGYHMLAEPLSVMNSNLDALDEVIFTFIIIISLLLLILSVTVLFALKKFVTTPLQNVHDGLMSFFAFINRKSSDVTKIHVLYQDEIGEMAHVINKNIHLSKNTLNEDAEVVKEVERLVQSVKEGFFSESMHKETSNPQLSILKKDLNAMLFSTKESLIVLSNHLSIFPNPIL